MAEPAAATLGGYVLFWFAFRADPGVPGRVGGRVDVSYGLYLYAWPLQQALIWTVPGLAPWQCFTAGTLAAALLGLPLRLRGHRPRSPGLLPQQLGRYPRGDVRGALGQALRIGPA